MVKNFNSQGKRFSELLETNLSMIKFNWLDSLSLMSKNTRNYKTRLHKIATTVLCSHSEVWVITRKAK